ncbi:MAG: PAS domain S-box protein, partial [Candidatus Polarisedimenticolia bacterium]
TLREAAARSEARFRSIFEGAPLAISTFDGDGRYLQANPALCHLLDLTEEELRERTVFDVTHPEDRDLMRWMLREAREGRGAPSAERRFVRLDGMTVWARSTVSWIEVSGEEPGHFLSMAQDTTDRRRAEEALGTLEARRGAIVQAALDAIVSIDHQGRVLEFNPAAERIFGYRRDEALGRKLADLIVPPAQRARHEAGLARYLSTGEKRVIGRRIELTALRAGGVEIPVELSIIEMPGTQPPIFTGFIRDLTERRQADEALRVKEEQLRQAQKMEAIGRLAGGVAHDFNNLLTVITGRSELLQARLAGNEPLRSEVAVIHGAAQRASGLTRQLLAFSRKQILQVRLLDLNEVVAGAETILRRLIGEDVELATVLRPDLGKVRADPGQIEQVIMNLAVNSRDAMPQGGRLTLETAGVVLDQAYRMQHPPAVPGPYVMLAVSDTGVGMDADTRAHLFEPFFTTKAQGTGLGLATVYGIVKQSEGYVWVYSEPGQGTTFKVYLPRAEEGARPRAAEEPTAPPPPSPGSGTVLVVEDEEVVRNLVHEILDRCGYTVLEARDAQDARRICDEYRGEIDLLLTDVVMPQMNGRALANAVIAMRPSMRVLYMSGYTDDAVVRHGILEQHVAFIQKPFTPDGLARKVRETLEAGTAPGAPYPQSG